jgi:sugar phosphate isomerase/epimerase
LDLPLLESYDPEDVKSIVKMMSDKMVYSHTISLASYKTIGGAPYSWEEVTPGSEDDNLPWETFVSTLKDVGYNGFLSHEQCSPIVVEGHRLGRLKDVDERYVDARNYFREVLKKYNCYSGNKPEYVGYK